MKGVVLRVCFCSKWSWLISLPSPLRRETAFLAPWLLFAWRVLHFCRSFWISSVGAIFSLEYSVTSLALALATWFSSALATRWKRTMPKLNSHVQYNKRQITRHESTCGFNTGGPTQPRTAQSGYDCRFDTLNKLVWLLSHHSHLGYRLWPCWLLRRYLFLHIWMWNSWKP